MASSGLIRLGGLAGMVSGVLFVMAGVLAFSSGYFSPSSSFYRTTEDLFVVALVLLPIGFVGFHALQRQNYGRTGRAGFWMVVTASLAVALGLITYFFLGTSGFLWLATSVGPVGLVVGFVLYGVATLQAKVLPRWCGVAFIIALPCAIALSIPWSFASLFIVFGLMWLTLSYVLWSHKDTSAERPSRVR